MKNAWTTGAVTSVHPYLALVLRVFLGASFLLHASPKLGAGTKQTVQWIKSMGIPAGAAYSPIALKLVGGIFLIVGLIVPIVGILFAIEMISNTVMKRKKMKAVYIGHSQNQPTFEIDLFYLALSLVLVVLGAGALSIDALLGA